MQTNILGIDPGTTKSGYVIYGRTGDEIAVTDSGEMDNMVLLKRLRAWPLLKYYPEVKPSTFCAIENIEGMGFAVGKTTFETCIWIGRFIEAWAVATGTEAYRISRGDERIVMCGGSFYKDPVTERRHKVGDKEIRQACINRFEPTGGGKTPQIGIKKQPGPLYGMAGHAWQALSVAITWAETHDDEGNELSAWRPKKKRKLQKSDLGI